MKVIAQVQHWFAAWFRTWPGRQPAKDIPALLAFLLGLAFLQVVVFWNPMSIRARYGAILNSELASGHYQTALVASHRLLSLDPSWRNQALFGMALAHQGLGHRDRASELMRMIAPPDRPVFASAHLFAARSLMRNPDAIRQFIPLIIAQLNQVLALEPNSIEANEILGSLYSSQEEWAPAEKHLLPLEPESIEANEILGSLYSSQKEWALAEKHFAAVIKEKPEYMLLLARIAKERGNEKAAENWTYDALVYFQRAVEKSAADNPKTRSAYLEALMMRGEVAKAKTVLDAGRKLSGDEPYKQVIAAVCSVLAQQYAARQPDDLEGRLKLIREGMDANPKNFPLLVLLLGLGERDGAESPAVGDRILKMAEKSNVWPPLLFAAAKIAWSRGDAGAEKKFLERACAHNPGGVSLANNLAVAGGMNKRSSLPFSLELAQFALEKRPDDPDIRMTRGVTLTRLSRVQEGLADLQFSLKHTDDEAPVHRALADAYLALGMKNLALEHFRLSNPDAKVTAAPIPEPTPGGSAGDSKEK